MAVNQQFSLSRTNGRASALENHKRHLRSISQDCSPDQPKITIKVVALPGNDTITIVGATV